MRKGSILKLVPKPALDLNLPRAISQLVEESILGGFVPPQPLNLGSERKPKPEYEIVEIVPPQPALLDQPAPRMRTRAFSMYHKG